MESLSDKLKSLGVHLGTSQIQTQKPASKGFPIESVLEGYDDETSLGNTFIVRNDYAMDYQHGSVQLCNTLDLQILAEWCHCGHVAHKDPTRFLFLDTETSGLAGGTGTFAFLIGLGFRTAEGFRLVQLFMRDPAQEPAMLASLSKIVEPFEVIVSFNGKGFDVPLLNTRHILNQIKSPFLSMDHIDMLSLARKIWRNRLPSRALKDLEVEILALPRTEEEVPGWMIPEMYFEYLRTGDSRPLAGVFYHNGMDILSLAAIFSVVNQMLNDPIGENIPHGLDIIALARMYEELGRLDMAIQLYETGLQRDLPIPFFLQTLQRFALLYRKQGAWEQAAALWQKAVGYHQYDAAVELAKYCEHQLRDYSQALHWSEIAAACLEYQRLPAYQKRASLKELDHRIARLQQKESAASKNAATDENGK